MPDLKRKDFKLGHYPDARLITYKSDFLTIPI